MRSKRVPSPSTILFTSGWVRPEPKGSILILSPWNYPLLLCLNPLIAAVASGNTAVIKPSEFTPASGAFLKKLIERTFDPNEVAVVLGDEKVFILQIKYYRSVSVMGRLGISFDTYPQVSIYDQ